MTFTKLFSSITESTIWQEDSDTRVVWITMLAMCNKNGYVFASVPGLAKCASVPMQAVLTALHKFQQPDEWSRSKEHEGRRIEEVDGGWRLLNYAKHRAIRDEEERQEYMKNYMREYRKKDVNNVSNVSRRKPPLAQAEAEADAEASKSKSLARLSSSDTQEIYELYPRKIGKTAALRAIEKAILSLIRDKANPISTREEAVTFLKQQVMKFAQSTAGNKGEYTPHPATWFNKGQYLDDPFEWEPLTEQDLARERLRATQGLGVKK